MEARSSIFFPTAPLGARTLAPRERPVWTPANGAFQIELRAPGEIAADFDAWQALAARALEPAPFAEPEMLLPALQHLSEGRQAALLLVWQQAGHARLLRGLFPVVMPRLPIAPGEVRLWRPPGFPLAPALLDRDQPGPVLEAVFAFCAARGARCSSFVFSGVATRGALAATVKGGRRRSELLALPVLWAASVAPAAQAAPAACPRSAEKIVRARSPAQIRDAVESFLVLEAREAKARGAMALIEDAGAASFIRTMTRQLARRGQCRVETLRRDGGTSAATVLLDGPDALWLWRGAGRDDALGLLAEAAAAEAMRAGKRLILSPDVHFTRATAEALALEPLAVADLLVSTRTGLSPSAAVTRLKTRIDRRLRAVASGGLQRLMRA